MSERSKAPLERLTREAGPVARQKSRSTRQGRHGERRWVGPPISVDHRASNLIGGQAPQKPTISIFSLRALSLVFVALFSAIAWMVLIYAGASILAMLG